jgi:hypothetical protein
MNRPLPSIVANRPVPVTLTRIPVVAWACTPPVEAAAAPELTVPLIVAPRGAGALELARVDDGDEADDGNEEEEPQPEAAKPATVAASKTSECKRVVIKNASQ